MDKRQEMIEKVFEFCDTPNFDLMFRNRKQMRDFATMLVDNGVRTADGFEINMKKGETRRLLAQHNIDMADGAKFLECWLRKAEIKPINYSEVDNEG